MWGNEGFTSICYSGIIRAAKTRADNNIGAVLKRCVLDLARHGRSLVGPHTSSLQTSCHGVAVSPGAPFWGEFPLGVWPQRDPAPISGGLHCLHIRGSDPLLRRQVTRFSTAGQWPSQEQNSDSTGSIPFLDTKVLPSFCWNLCR